MVAFADDHVVGEEHVAEVRIVVPQAKAPERQYEHAQTAGLFAGVHQPDTPHLGGFIHGHEIGHAAGDVVGQGVQPRVAETMRAGPVGGLPRRVSTVYGPAIADFLIAHKDQARVVLGKQTVVVGGATERRPAARMRKTRFQEISRNAVSPGRPEIAFRERKLSAIIRIAPEIVMQSHELFPCSTFDANDLNTGSVIPRQLSCTPKRQSLFPLSTTCATWRRGVRVKQGVRRSQGQT